MFGGSGWSFPNWQDVKLAVFSRASQLSLFTSGPSGSSDGKATDRTIGLVVWWFGVEPPICKNQGAPNSRAMSDKIKAIRLSPSNPQAARKGALNRPRRHQEEHRDEEKPYTLKARNFDRLDPPSGRRISLSHKLQKHLPKVFCHMPPSEKKKKKKPEGVAIGALQAGDS